MSRILGQALARAISKVDAMDMQQQEDLADEIFKVQPNLFGSVLALRRMGVEPNRMDFPVRMLLVCFQSMKESGIVWPTVSEKDLSRQLKRWLSSIQMGDNLNDSLRRYSTKVYIDAHPEKELLAFVTTSMAKWLADQPAKETDNYVVMAVQNLVNCVAFVGIE